MGAVGKCRSDVMSRVHLQTHRRDGLLLGMKVNSRPDLVEELVKVKPE